MPLPHHTFLEGNHPVNGSLVTSGTMRGLELKKLLPIHVLVAHLKYNLMMHEVWNLYPFLFRQC